MLLGTEESVGIGPELFEAGLRAKPLGVPAVLHGSSRCLGVDGHAANRIAYLTVLCVRQWNLVFHASGLAKVYLGDKVQVLQTLFTRYGGVC